MNYHMTKVSRLKDIIKSGGLSAKKIGENSKLVNDEKAKLSFSKGMEGVIQITVSFQKRYDFDAEERGETPKDLSEILGPSIYLCFPENLRLNEQENTINGQEDIADAYTTQDIPLENLRVCVLKNKKTNEVIYDREAIVKFMMSQTPVEDAIKNLPDRKFLGYIEHSDTLANYIRAYYKQNEELIAKYNSYDYELQTMDVKEFYEKIANVQKSFEDRLKEGAPSQEEQASFAKNYSENLKDNQQTIEPEKSDLNEHIQ